MNKVHLLTYTEKRAAALHFLTILFMLMVVFCFAGGSAFAQGDNGKEHGAKFCTKTTKAAFKACQHEVQDDYWVSIGNCNNLSEGHKDCEQEARLLLKEGKQECSDQRAARLEVCGDLGETPYDPQIEPSMFVDPAEIGKTVAVNQYFPLIRGRTWVYKGGTETITVTVTNDTKVILGVTCAVVHDVVQDNGVVIEDTKDWYAQDSQGNVWYFGEISQDFDNGELAGIEGSWTAGAESAKPGFIMKAAPTVGDVYRQEFSLANAEDMAEVLSLTGSDTVPAATCTANCLITKDFTPITPDAVEHKYYAPGIGLILEVDPETGDRLELVEIK
jgi:hypothetical protein